MVGAEGVGPSIQVSKSNEAVLGQHFCRFRLPSSVPHHPFDSCVGRRQSKKPLNQVAYSIFGAGQGIALLVVSENAPLLKYVGALFATVRD